MGEACQSVFTLRLGWFCLVLINFMFGISGVTICSLRLFKGHEDTNGNFYKLSIIFASCNLMLSVLLLVAVIKSNQKCSFLCSLLSLLSLFSAVIHVETNTSNNLGFLIVFGITGVLFLFWFCVYASYQIIYKKEQELNVMTQDAGFPTSV